MAFITEWIVPDGNFTFPLRSGFTYNMTIDWGDSSPTSDVTAYNDADATHSYTAGTYQISVTGTCGCFYNFGSAAATKLTKVIDWGNEGFTSYGLNSAFYGCINLTDLPVGAITGTVSITNVGYMFYGCTGLTDIPDNLFDNLTSVGNSAFSNTFYGCTGLTAIPTDLFTYSTSAGTNSFANTFYGCTGAEPSYP